MIHVMEVTLEDLKNVDYGRWNTTSFLNCMGTFRNPETSDFLKEEIANRVFGYLKFCNETNKFFPWGQFNIDRNQFNSV